MQQQLTIIESPFKGKGPEDEAKNVEFLMACCRDSLSLGEIPFASHGFYPRFMDDSNPQERELGMSFGYAYWQIAEKIVFYLDRGLSDGMVAAMRRCIAENKRFECRYLKKARTNMKPDPQAASSADEQAAIPQFLQGSAPKATKLTDEPIDHPERKPASNIDLSQLEAALNAPGS